MNLSYVDLQYVPPHGLCDKCGEPIQMDLLGFSYVLYCGNYCFIDIKPMDIPAGVTVSYNYYYGDKK